MIPQLGDPGGFALGPRTFQTLEAAGIRQTGWQWRYNTNLSRPTRSYPPHRDRAGNFIVTFPDDGYYPGDHKGCLCQATPVLHGPDGRFVSLPST